MAYGEVAFVMAKDVSTQLITVSSAIIGLSVTFIKEFKFETGKLLAFSWLLYLFSIVFGILTLMFLTGEVAVLAKTNGQFDFSWRALSGAGLQIICFFIATLLLAWFGYSRMRRTGTENGRMDPPVIP
jgi:hypothetical protein